MQLQIGRNNGGVSVWTPFSRININMTEWAEDNTWALVPRRVLCTPKSFKCWSSSCYAVRLTCTPLRNSFDFLKPHTYWISLYLVSYETQEPKRGRMCDTLRLLQGSNETEHDSPNFVPNKLDKIKYCRNSIPLTFTTKDITLFLM